MRARPSISARRAQSSPRPTVRPLASSAVIGVDVLAEQGELAHAGIDQIAAASVSTCSSGRRGLGAAGVGHDAEGAELVAAFLHGEEGGEAAAADDLLGRRPADARICLRRGIRFRRRASPRSARAMQIGQAVIGLRAEHQVHGFGAAGDLLALGLGDAAGDADDEVAAASALSVSRAGGRARKTPSRWPFRGCGRC